MYSCSRLTSLTGNCFPSLDNPPQDCRVKSRKNSLVLPGARQPPRKAPGHRAGTDFFRGRPDCCLQLAAKALQVKEDKPKLQKVIEEAMAGTDCGDCGYPDCFGYSDAIAQGKDFSAEKCAPGGADSKAMLETILVSLKTGVVPTPMAEAKQEAPAATPGAPAEPEKPKGPPLAQTLSKDELYKVVLDAMAGTDCGDCEYPDCDGYTKGIVYEGQTDLGRCAPGGEDTRTKLYEIMLGTKPPPK